MADAVSEPVADTPPAHGGGIKATIKRIKPGEWALIGLGVASLVLFYIWYQRQQASSTTSTTNPNPQWGNAQTGDSGTYAGELADLLSQIASGGFTTPTGALANGSVDKGVGTIFVGGGGGGGGGSPSTSSSSPKGSAGGSQGSGTQPDTTGTGTGVSSQASSGSGISQQKNNQSPISSATKAVHSVNHTSGTTGNTGIAISSLGPSTASKSKVPANVTAGSSPATGPTAHAQTVGAQQAKKPTFIPVNVVTSMPTHAAPKPVTKPSPPSKPPTKAPVNVRAR